MLPQELEDFFSISMKNLIGILVGFTLHLGIALVIWIFLQYQFC